MGIFSNIMSKISHHIVGNADAAPASPGGAGGTDGQASVSSVDVEAVLKSLAEQSGQPLNYQTSIVDLLKLLGLDSSLDSRQKLADELHYSGDKTDTASMNIWLIKQVYAELAKNGGKLPSGWGH